MAELGTPEWAGPAGDLWQLLPDAPGTSGAVNLSVALAPRREVAIHWRYEDGHVVGGGAGAAPDPALSLTIARADAAEMLSGRVEPSVAFMRGRLKASGQGEALLAFLRSTTSEAYDRWRSRVEQLSG